MAAIPYPRGANLTTYNGSDSITRAGQLLVGLFLLFDDPVDLKAAGISLQAPSSLAAF